MSKSIIKKKKTTTKSGKKGTAIITNETAENLARQAFEMQEQKSVLKTVEEPEISELEIRNEISAPDNDRKRLNGQEITFILSQIISTNNYNNILKAFYERFNKTISKQTIYNLKVSKKYEVILDKLQTEYDRQIAKEYLASPRRRVSALTTIYEKALDKEDLKLASEQVMKINEIILGKYAGGDMNIYFQQNNQYSQMTLPEIRAEQLKVLKMIGDVKMIVDKKNNDLSETVSEMEVIDMKTEGNTENINSVGEQNVQ